MHLFDCLLSMTTCNSQASTSSSEPAAKVHHLAAVSGSDHSSNNKRIDKNINLVRELRINYVVGDGISGILYKWVNFGKGWRPRWFVLQDGVLSFYKIHGPDKIFVSKESVKGSRVIGDESMKWILRQQHNHPRNPGNASSQKRIRKAVGEVHLKISTIQESRSNDKKFSIFTGTKWLHLHAESKEDRITWIAAYHMVKDMLLKIPKSEVMAPIDNLTPSTEKLRQVLVKGGLTGDAFQDIGRIMKNEFASLQNQLMVLKQKHWLLKETLRQLGVHVKTSRKSATSKNS